MDVYFATWIFYGTTSGSGSGFTVRRRSGCAEPSSRACAINAGSLRHARPQHRMSVQLDFCRANRTVAIAPATTVIKPPSSLMENGSIDMAAFFLKHHICLETARLCHTEGRQAPLPTVVLARLLIVWSGCLISPLSHMSLKVVAASLCLSQSS